MPGQPSTPTIQLGDPIAKGLVWAWTGNNRESISGSKATLATNGSWRTNRGGRAIGRGLWNSGTSGTGATWAYTSNTRKVGTRFTLLFWGDVTGSGASAKTFMIPANGSWSGTFVALGLSYTDGNTLNIRWTSSGSTNEISASTGAGTYDNALHCFAGTRNGATTRHYINGVQIATASSANASAVQFNTNQGVTLGGNPYVSGEYTQGYYPMAMIWARDLSASELMALYVDPWRLWRPASGSPASLGLLTPAAAGGSSVAAIAEHYRRMRSA